MSVHVEQEHSFSRSHGFSQFAVRVGARTSMELMGYMNERVK